MGSGWQYGVSMDSHKEVGLIPACLEGGVEGKRFPTDLYFLLITLGSKEFINSLFVLVMQRRT